MQTGTKKPWGYLALTAYIGTIILANWLITRFGIIPVGFGLMAPAGVYVVGLAFTTRDLTQRFLGRSWAISAIGVGAILSALISPKIALASGVAFLVSEGLDFAVYTPLERRNWPAAVLASNGVGLVVDSVLFLWLAFGSLQFLPGQIVGKAWVAIVALLWLIPMRRRLEVLPGNTH